MQKLAGMLRNAMIARVDAWAAKMATMQAGMGPMAPILSEYFDMVPMLGKQVAVIAPTGHVMDTGTFSGWTSGAVQWSSRLRASRAILRKP